MPPRPPSTTGPPPAIPGRPGSCRWWVWSRSGQSLGQVDPGALVGLFALINIFIGVFNLVPLLPFDGGHVAIAVYERIQERRLGRRRYFTDVSRLLPLTNVVVIALGLLFLSSLYLDVMNPIQT